MIDFGKVYFGCADANTEAERNPAVFSEVFFDPHNYLNELINGDRFILRGRKGDGKTAYSAKIKLSADAQNIYAYQRSLNNFNNATLPVWYIIGENLNLCVLRIGEGVRI